MNEQFQPEIQADQYTGAVTGILSGNRLQMSDEQLARSTFLYEAFREEQDEAVKVGLYGEDLQRVMRNPKTVLVEYSDGGAAQQGDESAVHMPLLVPADELKWYNMSILRGAYGYGKEYFYYAHPPIPEDENSKAAITTALKQKLDEGAIIFTDQYAGQPGMAAFESLMTREQETYSLENIDAGDTERTGEVFVGPVTFEGAQEVKEAPPISEIYRQMVADDELSGNPSNGVSLVETISGEEAERIWEIYKAPFDELSKEHPMYAGFSKEELMDILADPAVAKLVNKVNGTISTLCFFVDDFEHCPWFNEEYYRDAYPEYYDTNNILMFPGIVTDEHMRGNDYGMKVIDLATKLYSRRGSNLLVTFECTETSAIYIPTIVEMGIGHGGAGKITGLEQPISVTEYKAMRKIR